MAANSLRDYTLASLFAGVGGLDFGFLDLGATGPLFVELDSAAAETFSFNHRKAVTRRSVADISPSELKGAEIIVAGPPCQGFSSLGTRRPKDKRNDLILTTARLISSVRPAAFVIENVFGLTWLGGGRYMRLVLEILRKAGLVAQSIIVHCDMLGLAQRRRRVLIAGGRRGIGESFALGLRRMAGSSLPKVSVRDVLFPAPSAETHPNHEVRSHQTDWYDKVIPAIAPGQKLCDTRLGASAIHSWDLPDVFGRTSKFEKRFLEALCRLRRSTEIHAGRDIGDGRPVKIRQMALSLDVELEQVRKVSQRLQRARYVSYSNGEIDLARKFNGRFKRLPLDAAAPAVVREFAYARNILHPTESRALTVRECARLQGFPDTFRFFGSVNQQYTQVANAFPPPISRLLAAELARALGIRASGAVPSAELAA